jgi:signal transduction histidine kinase
MLEGVRALPDRLRRDDLADLALVVLLAAVATVETLGGHYGDLTGATLVVDVVVVLPLLVRRRYPLGCFLLVQLVIALTATFATSIDGNGFFLALLVGGYSLGAHAPLRRAVAGMLVFVLVMAYAAWRSTGNPLDDLDFIVMLVGALWIAGRVAWSRQQLVRRLADQSAELREARDAQARALVAEQRARIARDVHDVVAHSVSIMVVQAEAGEAQLPADARSAECLRAIQRVGRATLTELRGVLGAWGDEPSEPAGAAARTPSPRLRDAERLVVELGGVGLDVDLRVEGDVSDLPSGVDLAAYRVLQEALTNALRHSGDSHVRATVRATGDEVVVDVLDAGPSGSGSAAGAKPSPGAGRGLVGMRERVRVHGGDVQAGPCGAGFRVHARIPVPVRPEAVS